MNDTAPETKDRAATATPPTRSPLTLVLRHPSSGEERVVTIGGSTFGSSLDVLVDEGFAGPLIAALEVESEKPDPPYSIFVTLLALEVHQGRYVDAAARGAMMLQQDGSPEWLRMTVALAHHYAGLSADAYLILQEGGNPAHTYQMACCAARIGRYSLAMADLIDATETSEPNRVRSLLDEDFEPLWEHFASGAANFQECVLLASPTMARCFGPVPAYDGSLDYLDHFDFARLPDHLRPAVKPRLLLSTYVARQPGDRGYDDVLSNELFSFRVTEAVNRRGRATVAWEMATKAVSVLADAEEATAGGNMMHARWHLSEIVRNFPNAAGDIRDYCVNEKLRVLATEFGVVEAARPRFTSEAAEAYENKDAHRLSKVLKSCPPCLLSLGTIQIYHGHLALASGDREAAVHAYRAAAGCWPDDPAPFHNAALALAETGQWDEAADLIAHAPPSFYRVAAAQTLAARVVARDLTFNFSAASHGSPSAQDEH